MLSIADPLIVASVLALGIGLLLFWWFVVTTDDLESRQTEPINADSTPPGEALPEGPSDPEDQTLPEDPSDPMWDGFKSLPEDLPYRSIFVEDGIFTEQGLRSLDSLTDVHGIGDHRSASVYEWYTSNDDVEDLPNRLNKESPRSAWENDLNSGQEA